MHARPVLRDTQISRATDEAEARTILGCDPAQCRDVLGQSGAVGLQGNHQHIGARCDITHESLVEQRTRTEDQITPVRQRPDIACDGNNPMSTSRRLGSDVATE
ncbi:hypothetical protein [Nocardia sp. CDC160]|uniref:hypothetical protein n=1 Tax=Nocardia sp. CDC160 TaxID=3112166 RepID=UPI002DBF6D49|nr:hypothetical protein [Nocardia sp. CDC160]MEC3918407.1 hypothetical protein [Nocardia sp. CDC160]MEC3919144.1 hypothetical protein [Nocardia sp. CDC160]